MDASIGAAVLQFAPSLDRAENLDRIAAAARLVAERRGGLLVTPEYSSAFDAKPGPWMHEVAEPLDGEFVGALSELAGETGLTIAAGMLERRDDETGPWNTVVVVNGDGLVAHCRKIHLYDAFGAGESEWLSAGDADAAPVVFDLDGLRFGVQTCYDLRFPEVSRRLIDAGATALVVPAEWVRGPLKEHHWSTLLRARAIENVAYVVAADQSPPIGVGRSAVVDPRGVDVAAVGSTEGLALAWLSAEEVEAARAENPALILRRYEVAPKHP